MSIAKQVKWIIRIGSNFLIFMMLALGITAQGKVAGEKDWPRQIEGAKGIIVLYQPQLEMFNGVEMKGRCAISVHLKDASQPALGAIWFEAQLSVDRDTRLATMLDFKIPRARFAGSTPEQENKLAAFIEEEVPKWNFTLSLDRLLSGLEVSGRQMMVRDQISNSPPRIIVSQEPAALIPLHGGAQLVKIPNTNLMRVANSPFQIAFDPAENMYYLNGGSTWFSTQDLQADWLPVNSAPAALANFYTYWTREPKAVQSTITGEDRPPRIIISTEPTELIQLDGPPRYMPISGMELFYAANTNRDVFLDSRSSKIFLLLSGRWFRADSLEGPWEFVSADALPDSFSKMPANSPKRNVLVHVTGTELAKEAVLNSQIPQTAAISRAKVKLTVTYDGAPVFKPIERLAMQYAENTESAVISAGGRYYCCNHAIWYESDKPLGPWKVSVQVPDIIYSMPPSCPLYNVKFVRIYQSTPEFVFVGYTPGYTGSFRSGADTMVYGTGFKYSQWFDKEYIPRPITYGMNARYNAQIGDWELLGDYVSAGGYFRIIPGSVDGGGNRITRWSMAGWWWGGGYRDYQDVAAAARIQNIYDKYEADAKSNPILVKSQRILEPREAVVSKANLNNLYVDDKGKVYRRSESGWQTRQGAVWIDVKDLNARPQLIEEQKRRELGIAREQQNDAGSVAIAPRKPGR